MPNAVWVSLTFLVVNVVVPLLILVISQHMHRSGPAAVPRPQPALHRSLKAEDILEWEFEYARTTASEAMDQRHTMVNFYLLVAGFVIAGVASVWSKESTMPSFVGAALLWLLCGIGWIYFLSIIRLRQAWHDSARTMNRIKTFYIEHTAFAPSDLSAAFRWQPHTLPKPGKWWNVFFYSAMLIALLNSLSFVAGGALLDPATMVSESPRFLLPLGLSGAGLFGFHLLLYWLFLWTKPSRPSIDETRPVPPGTWVDLQREEVHYEFKSLFRVVEARLRYRRVDGRMSAPVTRVNFERGEAAGVLLYDPQQDSVVLVRQFRYPVYANLPPEARAGAGARQAWPLEMAAGIAGSGEPGPDVAQRELLEEAGYTLSGTPAFIATLYPSPGASSERIQLYLGRVDAAQQARAGGGLVEEGEDTEVVVLPLKEAMEMVARGEIMDAKTIVALQYLALQKDAPCLEADC